MVGWTGFIVTVNQSVSKLDLEEGGGGWFIVLFSSGRGVNRSTQGDATSYTSLMVRSEGMKLIELDDDM